jgi:hypothetical protein
LHWGVNNWQLVNSVYRPAGSVLFQGTGPAIQTQMSGPTNNKLTLKIGPFNKQTTQTVNKVDFVLNFNDGTWDNNNSADYHINITQATGILATFESKVAIYPNPSEEEITVALDNFSALQGEIRLSFVNMLGQKVKELSLFQANNRVSVADLPSGIYSVILENEGKRFISKQLSVSSKQ